MTETTSYARKHIIRWVIGKRIIIAGSAFGLDNAVALARGLTPPPGALEILITQGRIVRWRERTNA